MLTISYHTARRSQQARYGTIPNQTGEVACALCSSGTLLNVLLMEGRTSLYKKSCHDLKKGQPDKISLTKCF
jgi:hypothetical protein